MTSEQLEWTRMENHPITVIELAGEIDLNKKTEAIEEIVTGEETEHVALIMENVTYINSRGCGQLVIFHKAVENRGFHLYLVKTPSAVTSVIECLGISNILRMKEDLDEVIREVET